MIQQNLAVAVSYFGFFVGWSLIIASSVNIPMEGIKWYTIQVILKILLSLIMLPIFIKGIKVIFNINDDFGKLVKEENQQDNSSVETGYGIHEGAVFFTACYFTIVITGKINFETFYPTF